MANRLSDEESEAETARFYTEQADAYSRIEGSGTPIWFDSMVRSLHTLAGGEPLLLDVGCGSGRLFPDLQYNGIRRYIGVDLSPHSLAYAKSMYVEADFRLGNIHDLKAIVTETCDLFLAWDSLHHIPRGRIDSALAGIRSVLRIGALGLMTLPYGDEEYFVTNERLEEIPLGYGVHVCAWTEKSIVTHLERAGFSILDVGLPGFDSPVLTVSVRAL